MERSNRLPDQHSNTFYNNNPSSNDWSNSPIEETSRDERNDLASKHRRLSMQSSPHSATLPTGEAGQRQKQHQTEYGADLALRYHRVSSGTDATRPRSRTVLEPGRMPAGQSVTTSVPASITKMRHSRQPSNTAAAVTSPLMNPIPPSSTTNTTNTGRSRQKRREITDAPRHTRRTSRSASMLMAANPQQFGMDTEHMWNNPPPHFNGRRVESYPPNVVLSETPMSYSYGSRSNMNYQHAPPVVAGSGFSPSGIPAPGRLHQGIDAGASPFHQSRSSLGLLAGTPAGTMPDPQLDPHSYSQNHHNDPYGNVASASQYSALDNYGYPHLAHQPPVDPMSANQQAQQQQQHSDALYGPESHAHFYRQSQSPVSPRVPLMRSSPQQVLYQPYATGPNITVTNVQPYPATVEEIVKLNQVSYLPQTSYHLQSPLPAVSPPSEMSEPERHSPTLQSRSRVPGQRVDVDSKMLDASFRGSDIHSRLRRDELDDIQRQPWFHLNQDEPKMDVHAHRHILQHGLGMVGRSIYTIFLVEDKESNHWRCLFGGEHQSCKKSVKRFERVERAIEHVRSHLGHRPFACDGSCEKARSTGTICGKRFFAAGYLADHQKRPQKRANNQSFATHDE